MTSEVNPKITYENMNIKPNGAGPMSLSEAADTARSKTGTSKSATSAMHDHHNAEPVNLAAMRLTRC